MLKIKRWLETRRAPQKSDGYGGKYTPVGIDIFSTDDPELVSFDKHGTSKIVRADDLLAILDELDRYEGRDKLDGEKMEINLDLVKPEGERGDVVHIPGFIVAMPDPSRKGLVQLAIFSGDSFGMSITYTAERASLRRTLLNRYALLGLEAEDRKRHEDD